jgi:hypothetical protein
MKHNILTVGAMVFVFGIGLFLASGKDRRTKLDIANKEIILNQQELASVDRVLTEMKQRRFPFNRLQLVIQSIGDSYSLLFVEDAVNPKPNQNDTAIEWQVRKSDLKLTGPIFQK